MSTGTTEEKQYVVHFKKQPYDIYIGRPGKWGNPYTIGIDGNRREVIQKYREWLLSGEGKHLLRDLHELKGKVLGCWCSPKACHGDILHELSENELPLRGLTNKVVFYDCKAEF